jgi:hypothetical protein
MYSSGLGVVKGDFMAVSFRQKVYERLAGDNPELGNNMDRHDWMHAIAHPLFEKYTKDQPDDFPVFGADPKQEAIVTIMEYVLFDAKPRRINGDVIGSDIRDNNGKGIVDDHVFTFEEMKTVLGVEYLYDKKRVIYAKEQRKSEDDYDLADAIPHIVQNVIAQFATEQSPIDTCLEYYLTDISPTAHMTTDHKIEYFQDVCKALIELDYEKEEMDVQLRGGLLKYALQAFEEDYKMQLFYKRWDSSEEKKEFDKLQEKIDKRELEYPLPDNALEYYMKRAELIKEQLVPFLTEAGYKNLSSMPREEWDNIPMELFTISRNKVIRALHNEHPEKWGLPKTFISTSDIEHTPPQRIAVGAGRGKEE